MNINLTKPSIDEKEIQAVQRVFESGWLVRGKETHAFEQELAAFTGAKHAIATNGCTMALYLAVKQMNLQPTDEVIVPSLTWSATASIVIQAGATPVFADVKEDDWCLDPEDVKKKITDRTKHVIPVHYSGRVAKGFENFPIPVLFDSAHRISKDMFDGTTACLSFYAVKNMTTIRGGAILTNDDEAAAWYRMACHGGISQDTLQRYVGSEDTSAASFYYEVETPSWNFDMTDVEAAVGREQLKKVSELNKKREQIVAQYNKAFGLNISGNHMYPIRVSNRNEFLVNMKGAGIRCGIHYLPLHLMKGYQKYYQEALPVTESIGNECISLPLYADLTQAEIDYVIENVKKFAPSIKA